MTAQFMVTFVRFIAYSANSWACFLWWHKTSTQQWRTRQRGQCETWRTDMYVHIFTSLCNRVCASSSACGTSTECENITRCVSPSVCLSGRHQQSSAQDRRLHQGVSVDPRVWGAVGSNLSVNCSLLWSSEINEEKTHKYETVVSTRCLWFFRNKVEKKILKFCKYFIQWLVDQ